MAFYLMDKLKTTAVIIYVKLKSIVASRNGRVMRRCYLLKVYKYIIFSYKIFYIKKQIIIYNTIKNKTKYYILFVY